MEITPHSNRRDGPPLQMAYSKRSASSKKSPQEFLPVGTSYVHLSDVFNHDAAVRLHTGGMGSDVIHILKGCMNHMALIGIHGLTTLQFTSIRRLLLRHRRCLSARLPLQFTSIRRLLRPRLKFLTKVQLLAVHIHPQIVTHLR